MREIDLISTLHKSTTRDYLGRVNNLEYPKAKAAELAKKFGFEYWDGSRDICYGGYKYIPGRWTPVAEKLIKYYSLDNSSRILDIGCGKGFLMYELSLLLPNALILGIDISTYAKRTAKEEIKNNIIIGKSSKLPFEEDYFDLAFSINTFHCLEAKELEASLKEINRVSKFHKYICVESYRNEIEKVNLLYWQVTCEAFNSPSSWRWWFDQSGYDGDYSFIYFE